MKCKCINCKKLKEMQDSYILLCLDCQKEIAELIDEEKKYGNVWDYYQYLEDTGYGKLSK